MGQINVLDFHVANLIAAGEVVDRPASVAKELLENSIDAGATEIELEMRHGGCSLIRVKDNGKGMSKEDAELCILRHATSKIKEENDLERIVTLGFRGEALAAISAVSKFTVITRQKNDSVGTKIYADAGRILEVSDVGTKVGTTVTVEELFANVPARRKFLKRDRSEGMAVTAAFEKVALSHPEIAFKLISDGILKFQTVGDRKLYNTIYALLGRDFAMKLIKVQGETEAVKVYGYIGRPDNVKSNRNYQNFFINGRYVKSRTATAALEQAFSSFMESEHFPVCVLNIVLHPALVDVNVHPTKLEVKFSSEKTVFDAVYLAVRNAILNDRTRPTLMLDHQNIDERAIRTYNRFTSVYDRMDEKAGNEQIRIGQYSEEKEEKAAIPHTEKEEEEPSENKPFEVPKVPFDDLPFVFEDIAATEEQKDALFQEQERTDFVLTDKEPPLEEPFSVGAKEKQPLQNLPKKEATADDFQHLPFALQKEIVKEEPKKEKKEEHFRLIGIVFETYILAELGDKLLMIDKHAAHERLLFEKMKKNTEKTSNRYTELLMIPMEVELSTGEVASFEEFKEEIESAGFRVEKEGEENRFSIYEIPGGLSKDTALALFHDLVDKLMTAESSVEVSRKIAFEKALYTSSCKAAMKGRIYDSDEHLEYICKELLELTDIRYCPHGRPVAFEIPKGSIDYRFGRS